MDVRGVLCVTGCERGQGFEAGRVTSDDAIGRGKFLCGCRLWACVVCVRCAAAVGIAVLDMRYGERGGLFMLKAKASALPTENIHLHHTHNFECSAPVRCLKEILTTQTRSKAPPLTSAFMARDASSHTPSLPCRPRYAQTVLLPPKSANKRCPSEPLLREVSHSSTCAGKIL